ncbi:MAG: hypothetical protein JWQ91_816 [Aeromicrobium sp.]|jgi:hypothetical protein|uniref:variant leucine-rich repeat-containing protein n=1 Tax=Aeromicrobium sp. TaxID=1871063 RepID=UPI002612712F|nr:hypothetical protein [Aeromicrobium sp.]MCW2823899.1 hypothetical protein [Aeromicrobium sp.]
MSSDDLIREAQDPATPAARLQELAVADRATWPAIAAHPQADDGLLDWIGTHGDESVRAAIAARAADAPTEVVPMTPAADVEHTAVMPGLGTEPVADDPAPTVTADGTPSGGRRSMALLAAMIAVVLVLLGGVAYGATQVFGGDDDDGDRATTTRTRDAPTTATPSEAPTPPPSERTPPPSGNGEFCDAMEAIQDPSLSGLGSGVAPEDLNDVQDMLGKLRQAFDDLEASAPAEIKADVAVMSSFMDALADPTGSGASDMAENADKYARAVARVGQYYAQTCS